jgi:hypothetical protein
MTADKRWLRDRVTRVLFPAQIPKGRVNWPLAAGIALTVAAAFAVLTVSVRFTVKKFTDRERVNAVLQAARELGDPLPFDFYTYDEDKKITISGSLVTPDDADGELAGGLLLNSRMFNANYSLFSQFEERAFSKAVPRGKITVSVWAENYAPVRTEPISPMPTQREISGLTVSLRKGFTGSVRFVDEQGRAVAGVQCGIKFAPTEGGELAYQQELVSDANGLVTVSNVDDSAAYIIESGRAGYQDRKLHRQQFSPDQPLTLTLAAARTVSGQINDEHGQPLPGVTVNYIGSDHSRSFPGKSLIVSDARGHVTLDTLSDEINGLQLTADGHVPCELFIIPSQREFTATLVRGFTVSGTVANLQTLPAGVRSIVRLPLYYTFQAASSRRTQTFQLDNKTDHAAFSLNNIPAGVLELKLGNYTTTVDVSGDVKNFVWDLSTTLPLTVTERKITLRVTPGNSNIAPKGILGLKVAQGDEHSNLWQFHYLTLVNGIADFTAPAPCKLTISVGELAGFYFDEQTFTVSDTDDAPVELVIHAKPAGAIYGQTFDVDGRLYVPERKFVLRKDADRDRFTEKKPLFDTREASSRGGNFLDASLPLNATYRVLLQDQCHFTLSAPLTVTAAAPVRRVELRRQRGVDVRGQVIPAADSQMPPNLYFEYRLDGGPAGAGRVIPIAADGGFVLPDLNLDLPGEYRLKCEGVTVSVTRDTSRPLTIDLLKKSARR